MNNKIDVYSGIGYIQVNKNEFDDPSLSNIAFEKKLHKMEGKLSKVQLSDKIVVNLKTLYGTRKVHTFEVFIKQKISVLIDKLIEEEASSGEKNRWNPNF